MRTHGRFVAAVACVTVFLVACGRPGNTGEVWGWGFSLVPLARELSNPSGVTFTHVAVGSGNNSNYGIALDTSGRAWGWGANAAGALGSPGALAATPPALAATMPPGVTFTAVSAGSDHVVALDHSGRAWAWGSGKLGELGNGTTADSPMPVAVTMPPAVRFTAIASGFGDDYALDQNGGLWGWGWNSLGALGKGSVQRSGAPVLTPLPVPLAAPAGIRFTQIAADGGHASALDMEGRVWAWGDDRYGEVGNGVAGGSAICAHYSSGPCYEVPTQVVMPAGVTFVAIGNGADSSYALDASGHAWAWGSNQYGQLGIGTIAGPHACSSSVPTPCADTPQAVSMPSGIGFTAITGGGQHAVALDTRGAVWAFGTNTDEELGAKTSACPVLVANVTENQPCSTTPVRVTAPAGVRFVEIGAVDGYTFALSARPAGS